MFLKLAAFGAEITFRDVEQILILSVHLAQTLNELGGVPADTGVVFVNEGAAVDGDSH